MKKVRQTSVVPLYGVAALWLLRAVTGNLYSGGQIAGTVALSILVYLALRLFFPGKMTQEEEPARKQEPPKQEPPKQEPKPQPAPEKPKTTGNPELDQVLAQGQKSIAEIQSLNDAIPDFKLSAQIKQLEILTDKIFAYVRQNPSKLGQIRQFLDYYLPTTIKLLRQYVELQNQGMRMGNIDEGMKKIEDMLDKIIVAFQKQLDSLFESDVVDITADIQVMENMMASQGLTDKKDF
jgi:flagellar motor protein MotB